MVVAAYGLLIPESLLERGLWLNVHPSLLPRWRGAAPVERALLAGDDGDGRDDPRDGQGARRRPDRGAARVPARRRRTTRGPSTRVRPSSPSSCSTRCCRARRSRRRRASPRTPPRSRPADRELDLSRPEESLNRIRALSPHIGARGELDGRRVTIWRARLEDGRLVPRRGAAGGRQADAVRRVAPRPAVSIAPARRGGVRGRPPRLRGGRLRRPRAPLGVGEARRPRPGARAAARLRDGAAGADARPRDRDARQAAGAEARRAGARGAPARRLPARLPRRRAPLRGRERVGRARPPRPARARRPVHERRAPPGRRRDRAAAGGAAGGAAASTPTRTGSGTSGGATSARRRRWR